MKVKAFVLLLVALFLVSNIKVASVDRATSQQRISELETQVLQLQSLVSLLETQMAVNYLADCSNENMLRGLYSVEPIEFEDCVMFWFQYYEDRDDSTST